MKRKHVWSSLAVAVGVTLLAGCASTAPTSGVRRAGSQPAIAVTQFLEFAEEGDLQAMARNFGTEGGDLARQAGNPIRCALRGIGSWFALSRTCISWQDIEIRMNTIAVILAHDSFRVASENPVPGRRRPTARIGVEVVQPGGGVVRDVPFLVVHARDGRWLVEEIGLERLTGGR
jgi:hypothetical protein